MRESVPLRWLAREVDTRAGSLQPPLLSVSIHRGVVPRSEITDDEPRAEDLSNYKLCWAGDLVLNRMRAFQGAIGIAPIQGLVSPDYLVLRAATDSEPRFLHHMFRSAWFVGEMTARIRGIGSVDLGAARTPRINADDLLDISIRVPSLEEQRRIADFLDDQVARIDNIIAARKRQILLAEEAKATAIRDGAAGALPGAQTFDSGVAWIGRVANDGHIRALARILTLQRGVDLTADERRPGEVPVVTTAGIVGAHDTAIAYGPGVVIGRYGTTGSVYWIDGAYWPHNTTLYVKEFFGNEARWCYYLLQAYPYAMLQARSAVPGINRNDMAPDPMPWIPLESQRRAAAYLDERVEATVVQTRSLARAVDLLEELKRSLITAAVTGEFDVSSADGSRVVS